MKANPTAVIAGIATVLGIVLGGALIATVTAIAGVVTSFGFLVVAIGAGVTALVHFGKTAKNSET